MLKNDQIQIEGTREVKREIVDYDLIIRCAKEICMVRITKTVLVSGKGQQYFINKFLGAS